MPDEERPVAPSRGRTPPAAASRAASAIAPDTAPAEQLIERGMALRFRAPELAMVFGERAAALAEAAGSEPLWAHAEGLAVFARVRLGQRASVVNRAVVALRTAEADGHVELAAQMRTELALCARSVGVPLTGLAALRPVLSAADIPAASRAVALLQLVGCMAPLGRRQVLERALTDAAELAASDGMVTDEDRVLLRALVYARTAAHHRRYGDIAAALHCARGGLDLLDDLDAAADGIQLRVRLLVEMVCALLDRGETVRAAELAEPLLSAPARASAAGPLAWLRLAVATKIYLPAGAAEAAGMLVRDAIYAAERHALPAVTARLWLELSHIEERVGRYADAVKCLHEARMNEHAYSRVKRQALGLLIGEFGRGEQHVVDLPRVVDEPRRGGSQSVPPQRRVAEASKQPPGVVSEPAPPTAVDEAPVAALAEALEQDAAERPVPDVASEVAADVVAEPTAGSARHSGDGGADARSVLERLGVTVRSGGRRRAPERPPGEEPAAAGKHAGPAEPEQSVAEPAAPEPEASSEPRQMDSVLAVFSNWRDGDEATPGVAPRPRRRRHDPPADAGALAANGRQVNGDDSAVGRHRGEA